MDMNEYRVLSVHLKDYETIKNWAYHTSKDEKDIVSHIVEHFNQKILTDRKESLESIYYSSDQHKELFEKHLGIEQFSNYKSNHLVCFYINSYLGIYIKDLDDPMKWIGDWNEDHTQFKASTQYRKLEKDDKRLVDYASVLLSETDPLCILTVFSHIENKNVILAQEMLRLKLIKI